MALYRVVYVDGHKDEVATTMGDAMMAERRGIDIQKQGLEAGLGSVFVAIARTEHRPPIWKDFVNWANSVEAIETDSQGEPNPTQEEPQATP